MARFLIAGCGYVGTALAERLVDEGHEVFALRRSVAAAGGGRIAQEMCGGGSGVGEGRLGPDSSPSTAVSFTDSACVRESIPWAAPSPRATATDRRPARPASGIRWIRADLTDVDTLRALPPRLDYVCYLASAGASDDRAYRSAYVDGLRYLLAALDGQPIRRFLYASSTGVYAQAEGERVDEESPVEPRHFSGVRLLEGERLLRQAAFPTTAVRFAGIYGPGRMGIVDRVQRGEAQIPAGPPVYANRIHRDDCAEVLRHLSFLDSAAPLYLASDHDPADTATVLRWIAERLSVPAPRVAERAGPVERYGRTSNKRVDNSRLLASGYRFRYPTFREGYGALITAAEASGELTWNEKTKPGASTSRRSRSGSPSTSPARSRRSRSR